MSLSGFLWDPKASLPALLHLAIAVSFQPDEEGRIAEHALGYVGLSHMGSQGCETVQVGKGGLAGGSAQCVAERLLFVEDAAGEACGHWMDGCVPDGRWF